LAGNRNFLFGPDGDRSPFGDNQIVLIVPRQFVHQQEVAAAVRRAEDALRPDVVLIRFSLASD
jgi:hypothetical protein